MKTKLAIVLLWVLGVVAILVFVYSDQEQTVSDEEIAARRAEIRQAVYYKNERWLATQWAAVRTPQPTLTPRPTWTSRPTLTPRPTFTPCTGVGGYQARSDEH